MNEIILIPPTKTSAPEPEVQPPEDTRPTDQAPPRDWRFLALPASALLVVFGLGWASASVVRGTDRVVAEALNTARAQRQEVVTLRGEVESLSGRLEAQAQKSHVAETTLANLQKALAEQKAEAATATSQLMAKLEKAQTLAAKAVVDRAPVAAIPPAQKPAQNLATGQVPNTVYRAFVLRDIAEGRAVVEGAHGLSEVGPGDVLPGGARVQRIEKRGANWVVLTDRGAINPDGRWDD